MQQNINASQQELLNFLSSRSTIPKRAENNLQLAIHKLVAGMNKTRAPNNCHWKKPNLILTRKIFYCLLLTIKCQSFLLFYFPDVITLFALLLEWAEVRKGCFSYTDGRELVSDRERNSCIPAIG